MSLAERLETADKRPTLSDWYDDLSSERDPNNPDQLSDKEAFDNWVLNRWPSAELHRQCVAEGLTIKPSAFRGFVRDLRAELESR